MKIAIIALAALLPVSQAVAGEHGKKDIKMLNDAAAALDSKNPSLATEVRDYASREGAETEENEAAEEGSRDKDVQTLRDAAAQLKDSRPDLSKSLRKFAAKEEKEGRGHRRSSTESSRPADDPSRPGTGY